MIGLLATLIAAVKRRTGFAIFAGLLSVWNIYAYINGEADDIWIFGWVLFVISIFMKTKTSKPETIIINNTPTVPTAGMDDNMYREIAAGDKFCGNCGKPLQTGNRYCPNCGSKID